QTDVGHIAGFARRMAKGPGVEAIVTEAFKTLKAVARTESMRLVYSPGSSSWHDWKAKAQSVEMRPDDEWPAPNGKDLTVMFDPDASESGFISVSNRSVKVEEVLQILAPEILSALLLQAALAKVQKASISESELVRQTLRTRD